MKIKKNDNVTVVSGKDKGVTGKVTEAFPRRNKVVVESVNVVKRHAKSSKKGESGEIIEKSLPIDVSNVMLLDPKENKPTRIGYSTNKEGKKVRVAKKSGQNID
ncbi:MAG: 50S ribosomal protein L24 [Candidatus Campbellbacteria bacterium]|nr:50S ribosomal protein L24 [Candidatus Campbellbacteria bacterium]